MNMKTHTNISITYVSLLLLLLYSRSVAPKPYRDSHILCVTRIHNFWSSATNEFESFLFSFHAGNFSVIKWALFCFALFISLSLPYAFNHSLSIVNFNFISIWFGLSCIRDKITVKWFSCLLIFSHFLPILSTSSSSFSSSAIEIVYFHLVLFVAIDWNIPWFHFDTLYVLCLYRFHMIFDF